MREKLKDGGGGSCHMRSSTQSSDKHLGVRLFDCSIPVTDISFKQLGKYVTLAINITVGSKDNAGGVQLLCQSTTLQMDL
ncbi:hypothetical protein T05_6807 [Trichinella murrelli]|uniref:Uncharacterized protein n=1 Tax=Trichinella murrelli TaxID=144512 RepID=A0A0V0UB95_9BILA|nr:hypothetical protein T05_6807 [Trichinella murrelli]